MAPSLGQYMVSKAPAESAEHPETQLPTIVCSCSGSGFNLVSQTLMQDENSAGLLRRLTIVDHFRHRTSTLRCVLHELQ